LNLNGRSLIKQYDNTSNSTVSPTKLSNKRHYHSHRRQNSNTSNDFSIHHTSSTFLVPVVASAMNTFFQATKVMEDEILLPSKLKDMNDDPTTMQPENWHDLYTFIKDIRNQLQCNRPFAMESTMDYNNNTSNNSSEEYQTRETLVHSVSNGFLQCENENGNGNHSTEYSSASSTTSELSSTDNNTTSPFEALKEELKFHYYGLINTLENLSTMANSVTDKYRDDSTFKLR